MYCPDFFRDATYYDFATPRFPQPYTSRVSGERHPTFHGQYLLSFREACSQPSRRIASRLSASLGRMYKKNCFFSRVFLFYLFAFFHCNCLRICGIIYNIIIRKLPTYIFSCTSHINILTFLLAKAKGRRAIPSRQLRTLRRASCRSK
jgi:hypothetical protein